MHDSAPRPRVNGLVSPLGIADANPRFTWRGRGDSPRGVHEIVVATSPDFAPDTQTWNHGELRDPEFGVRYGGDPLRSRTRYWWRVRVVHDDGSVGDWSETSWFETGILHSAEWSAQWITSPRTDKSDTRTLYFRTVVDLPSAVVRARVYASALGWYRLFVNDTDLTGHALVPRWTAFDKAVEYQVYDATDAFRNGGNVIGISVAEGRFRGHIGGAYHARVYGDRLSAFAQVELELADGTSLTIGTDETWRVGTGRILTSDPMSGERVDLRISADEWLRPDGATVDEHRAINSPERHGPLIGEEVARVRVIDRLPGTVTRTPAGAQLIDFGQCFAGVARVRLRGAVGTSVRLLYSEVLRPDGEVDTDYLGAGRKKDGWFQRDEVILGDQDIDYTPWFTIHGFRFVSVEGLDAPLRDDDVEGIVLSTDVPGVSEFTASDPRLEQLWRNTLWSLRSNFTDTATDCPSRERAGWTGDIQVFAPTALQLVDSEAFLRRYLRNLALEQHADGTVPPFVPAEQVPWKRLPSLGFARTSAGWGDASVMIPWAMYSYLGDDSVLERQYPSAKAWVDYMERRARTQHRRYRRVGKRLPKASERFILDRGYNWGEWLRPGEPYMRGILDNLLGQPVVATAYLAHSSRLLARIAGILGETADAAYYAAFSERVAEAWRAAFVTDGGARIGEDKQDEYVRALAFDLLLPEQRKPASGRLVELIQAAGNHLGTGFLSTPMILGTLADAGHADVALQILLQPTSPSWMSQIAQGATSIWETWEGYKPDGRASGSHNHYAFGAVVAFLHERIAGLAPAEPGYRHLRIAPLITGDLTYASAAIETPLGRAASSWSCTGREVQLTVQVPNGATAEIEVGDVRTVVGAGRHSFRTSLS